MVGLNMTFILGIFIMCFSFGYASWWHLNPHMAWNNVIGEPQINTDINGSMFVVDLFDVHKSIINDFHRKGKKVICYFSAGTKEDWRNDAGEFPSDGLGIPNKLWPGETWVDIRNSQVRRIMRDRIELANSRHCDGVDPDNVDGYSQNQAGLHLTPDDQLDFNRYLATACSDTSFESLYYLHIGSSRDKNRFAHSNTTRMKWVNCEAHGYGLAIGLKNDVSQLDELVGDFDFAVNESCMNYNECDLYKPFFYARKPVFHIQYVSSTIEDHQKQHEICFSSKRPHEMNTIIKDRRLDNWKLSC